MPPDVVGLPGGLASRLSGAPADHGASRKQPGRGDEAQLEQRFLHEHGGQPSWIEAEQERRGRAQADDEAAGEE